VSPRKTLTTAPPKFVQRLITAREKLGKQRNLCQALKQRSIAVMNFGLALVGAVGEGR